MRLKRKPTEEHRNKFPAFQPFSETGLWIKAQIWLNIGQLHRAELGVWCCELENLSMVEEEIH